MRLTSLLPRLLLCLLPLVLSGCVAYRPRLLKYAETDPLGVPPSQVAVVTVSGEGALFQIRENGPWRPLHTGDKVPVGSLLLTHGDSELIVELPDAQGQVRVANGSTVEVARLGGRGGTLLVLTSGSVTGSISGAPIELISPRGGSLGLNPADGATVPFEFHYGRDARYYEVARSLGLAIKPEWSLMNFTAAGPYVSSDTDMFVFRSPRGNPVPAVPEPSTWALLVVGGALGWFLRRRNT